MKKGFFFAVASAFLLSLVNLFVKILGNYQDAPPLPSSEIAFFRGLIASVAVLIYMRAKCIRFSTKDRGLLIMRGLFGGFGMLFNFVALIYMKMSDAAILFQLSGIFVLIFSALFLKEGIPNGSAKWLLLIFIAVMVMVNPFGYSASFGWPAFIAICGAALSAAAYTTIRSISKHGNHSSFEIMAYFLITGMLAGAITMFTLQDFVVPDFIQSLYLLAIGAITVIAQFFLTGAFITTNAVVAQFLQYIGVFFSSFFGFLAFGENLSLSTIIAGIAIFFSSIMLARLKEESRKKS
ncbi:DMT family transporter [Pasteurellaceae bacterium LIM206]|nr:DMT family transporter [Pasteurellaceae bacterium LIM206]